MSKEELAKTLDYILNRSNEQDIEVLAAAVVRRRRDISMYGNLPKAPDPKRLAEEIEAQFNLDGSVEGIRQSVRDYAMRIIKQQAPELEDSQIDELMKEWIPGEGKKRSSGEAGRNSCGLPTDLLASMVEQFISFSLGEMEEEEDKSLRKEMGLWPDKYWKSFPNVIKLLITDFLKGEINRIEFNTRLGISLQMH